MNVFSGMGRLTREPELKATQNGISYVHFTIAINRRFKNKQTDQYETDFIRCTAWRSTAEFIAQYFQKGQMIAVVGTVQTRTYEDEMKVKRTATEVLVDQVSFTGDRKDSGANRNTTPDASNLSDNWLPEDDTALPFDL